MNFQVENNIKLKYSNQKLSELKKETVSNTKEVRKFNIPFSAFDRTSRKK